jgi:folylpolyglutamate synthase/dihydropteroate synthase
VGIARELLPQASEVVLTRPRLPRALEPDELARRLGRWAARAHRERSVSRALARARRLARDRGGGTPVVVAGTLFLVGEVKGLLERGHFG